MKILKVIIQALAACAVFVWLIFCAILLAMDAYYIGAAFVALVSIMWLLIAALWMEQWMEQSRKDNPPSTGVDNLGFDS